MIKGNSIMEYTVDKDDEDITINKEIAKKTPTVSIKQFNVYIENNKNEFRGLCNTASKKHSKKWRNCKKK